MKIKRHQRHLIGVEVYTHLIGNDLYLINDMDYTIGCRQVRCNYGGISNANALGTKLQKFVKTRKTLGSAWTHV